MSYSDIAVPASAGSDLRRRALTKPMARSVLTAALGLGVVADSLFRDGSPGLAVPLWTALVALNLLNLAWQDGRSVPRESSGWLLCAVLFSSGFAWRNAELVLFLDLVATAGCLGMAAIRMRDPRATVVANRIRDLVVHAARYLFDAIPGILVLAATELFAPGEGERIGGRAKPLIRAGLLAAAVLVVFGSLLRGADPIFASLVALPPLDMETVLSHGVVILFFTALTGGWARAALLPPPDSDPRSLRLGFTLGSLDVTMILGTLVALFTAFLGAQLGWLFGGEQFLRERTGLTAAEYARRGFFQMVWVVTLVVPVLIATRAALPADRALERRHTVLSVPVIVLLGAMIVSAALRLQMYVGYFGLTTDRLYPLVFMAWLAVVLVWLTATVLRGRGERFVGGALVSGLATLALLNLTDPEGFIARTNVERAKVDVKYLSRLGGSAVPIAVQATLAVYPASPDARDEQCAAANTLLNRFGPPRRPRVTDGAWRFWNADNALGEAAVRQAFVPLERVRAASCRANQR
jgi:hypothetical protein